ncbi:MAG: DNA translocase FtsK 4TM domain-containing protein [Alphaproteobacteria bacterium GM7ARS4]|nr:DNA translocase FtsK 4TM domain-containing protein [Alphaproteobacteria bacterium GM7ARS4]
MVREQVTWDRVWGVSWWVGTMALACVFFSFSPDDRSLNVAGDMPVQHVFGIVGAYGADILRQSFGYAVVTAMLVFALWGVKYAVHRPPCFLKRRLFALLCACIFVASSLHAIAMLHTGVPSWALWGGMIGKALYHVAGATFSFIGMTVPILLALSLASLAGVASMLYACGLTSEEWRWLAMQTRRMMGVAMRFLLTCIALLGQAALQLWHGIKGDLDKRTSFMAWGPRRRDWHDVAVERPDKSYDKNDIEGTRETPLAISSPRASLHHVAESAQALPSIDVLHKEREAHDHAGVRSSLEEQAALLVSSLQDFGIKGRVLRIEPGPVVTLYAFEPAAGVKTSSIIALSHDLARALSALSVRVALMPGHNVIGIEVPRSRRRHVFLHSLLSSIGDKAQHASLPLALGTTIGGDAVMADLSAMPHLLVAGTTGSGKSVALNGMILTLLFHLPASLCRFLMIDPKRLELSAYDGIPHLLTPVITEPEQALSAFKWLVKEMERRYGVMSAFGVRHIDGYNKKCLRLAQQNRHDVLSPSAVLHAGESQAPHLMPFIVAIVDEVADLMLVSGRHIEGSIQRLAQMARAAGIHIILATQRPSVDVLTGTIKANFPTRISFQVTTKIDSRTILGEQGAEQLLGQGDMLLMQPGKPLQRLHAPFVSDDEVEHVVQFLKARHHAVHDACHPAMDGETPAHASHSAHASSPHASHNHVPHSHGPVRGTAPFVLDEEESEDDKLYGHAVTLVREHGRASISFIQRHLQIGYNRAARLMERMEQESIVSPADHAGRRTIIRSP